VPGPERRVVARSALLIDLGALAEPDPGPPEHLAGSTGPSRKKGLWPPQAKLKPQARRRKARV
jgi:hypothetical protein